jgi:hypothetical protein
MSERMCCNCVYVLWPLLLKSYREEMGWEEVLPLCCHHAETPGRLREVHPDECCRNFLAERVWSKHIETLPEPPSPDIKYIPLNHQRFAIVDAADYEWLSKYRWFAKGGGGGLFYAGRAERGRIIMMHREIMQTPPGMVTDHINHNPVDNRRVNLRNCTPEENQRNRRAKSNKSGFVGVYPYGKRWRALIQQKGEVVYEEVFDDKVEAAKARDRKVFELFGEVIGLNFPEEIQKTTIISLPVPRYIDLRGLIFAHTSVVGCLTVRRAG